MGKGDVLCAGFDMRDGSGEEDSRGTNVKMTLLYLQLHFVQGATGPRFMYKSTVLIPLIAFSSHVFEKVTIRRDI